MADANSKVWFLTDAIIITIKIRAAVLIARVSRKVAT